MLMGFKKMRLSKKAMSTMLLIVGMGIILVIVSYFPPGKAIAKELGFITTDQTTRSYNDLSAMIKDIGTKAPAARISLPIKMAEDSAIMGFSAESKEIELTRWGTNFKFQKPSECGGGACICVCKQIVHDVVTGYYCMRPKPGEAKSYIECDKSLGVDIVNELSENEFVGEKPPFLAYGLKGGFIIGRFTKDAVVDTGTAGGLVKSRVFDVSETSVVYVEKGQGNFVAVCFRSDSCISAAKNEQELNKQKAVEIYNKAEREFQANTPESLNRAATYYEAIFIDQKLVDGLKYASADFVYLALFNRGMTQYRLGNYQKAVEMLDQSLLENIAMRKGPIPTDEESRYEDMIRKEKMKIDCDFARKDCSCYYHYDFGGSYWDECIKSKLKCYKSVQKKGTEMCSPCSQVKACSDYAKGNEFGLEKPVCQENFCKLSPACKWSDEDLTCVAVS